MIYSDEDLDDLEAKYVDHEDILHLINDIRTDKANFKRRLKSAEDMRDLYADYIEDFRRFKFWTIVDKHARGLSYVEVFARSIEEAKQELERYSKEDGARLDEIGVQRFLNSGRFSSIEAPRKPTVWAVEIDG
jgi:hypothetical protein